MRIIIIDEALLSALSLKLLRYNHFLKYNKLTENAILIIVNLLLKENKQLSP